MGTLLSYLITIAGGLAYVLTVDSYPTDDIGAYVTYLGFVAVTVTTALSIRLVLTSKRR